MVQGLFSSAPQQTEPPWNSARPRRASLGLGCAHGASIASPASRSPQASALFFSTPALSSRVQDLERLLAAQKQGTRRGAAGDQGAPTTVTPVSPGRVPPLQGAPRVRASRSICLRSEPRAAVGSDAARAGALGGAGGEIRCFEQINADDPRAVGPARAEYEICISAFHFHMVFMGPPCRNKSKSLIQKPPSLADLLPN